MDESQKMPFSEDQARVCLEFANILHHQASMMHGLAIAHKTVTAPRDRAKLVKAAVISQEVWNTLIRLETKEEKEG